MSQSRHFDRDTHIKALTMYQAVSQILQASRTPRKLQPAKNEAVRFLNDMSRAIAADINLHDQLEAANAQSDSQNNSEATTTEESATAGNNPA